MKLLYQVALENRRHLLLLLLAFVAMFMLEASTAFETFSLKVLTSTDVDFFELFAEKDQGALVRHDEVSWEQVQERFQELDADGKGYVTPDDSKAFLSGVEKTNVIDRIVEWMEQRFSVLSSFSSLAYMLLLVAVFRGIALFAHRFMGHLVAIRVSRDLRQKYFDHIQRLPMSFYQRYRIGSLSARVVSDGYLVAEAINGILLNYVQMPFRVITTMILCFLASWRMSIIIFLGFPLMLIPIVYLARLVKKVARQVQKNQENFASVLIDFLSGIQTVKVFSMEDYSRKKYEEQNYRMARLEARGSRYDCMTRPIVHAMATAFLAMTLLYGLHIDQMSISQMLFFCVCLLALYEPVKKFAELNAQIQRGVAAAERMFEVLNIRPQIEDKPDALELTSFRESISFEDVWFRYEEDWILKGLSFEVRKGETVAIVGPTGAGKSTITNLLPRLYEAQKGCIRVDGKPIDAYTQRSLRDQIAFVPQKPFLFMDTVARNIAFGQDFPMERIVDSARKAHAHEFIQQLPEGYDTPLSEAGKNLSGGQQQRLAIARALAKQSSILVMDEATSSLDTVSEERIKKAIEGLQGDVTQIIIAHRFSTIEKADRIIFLEEGRKVAEGTREELLESCPKFREMWRLSGPQHATA